MRVFRLIALDHAGSTDVHDVSSFVAEDESGSFGLLAGHARFMTVLTPGLARFRIRGGPWQYLAMPGASLYFVADVLTLGTRRYFIDNDYTRISEFLKRELRAEEQTLQELKQSLRLMEEQMLKRLWRLARAGRS